LTTHYIEEAEQMAERIGIIDKGEIILVEDKAALMEKLGKKQLTVHLLDELASVPAALAPYRLELSNDKTRLVYTFDAKGGSTITDLLRALAEQGIGFKDLESHESSLEEIFVSLVKARS
jgi:ABC-2 type transport system ATP-binding protein